MSFANTWTKNNQREFDHSLRNLTEFFLPFPNTDFFKRCPLYDFPKSWNNLNGEIKCQHNRYTFKIALTNQFFSTIYNESHSNQLN